MSRCRCGCPCRAHEHYRGDAQVSLNECALCGCARFRGKARGLFAWGVYACALAAATVTGVPAIVLTARHVPVLTQGSWPFLMGGAEMALALGAGSLAVCVSGWRHPRVTEAREKERVP